MNSIDVPVPTAGLRAAIGGELRLGGWLLGLGALGLIATCLCYVLAGPTAALPAGAANRMAAIAATPAAAGWMRGASLFGMPSDVLLAVGSLLLASHEQRRGEPVALGGWLALGLASALFIVVDAMVGFVLPLAAAQPDGAAAYAGLRALFDVLFSIGAWAAAGGALATAWRRDATLFRAPAAAWAMRVAGAVGLAATTGHLLGAPTAPFIGPAIALLALAALGAAFVCAKASA